MEEISDLLEAAVGTQCRTVEVEVMFLECTECTCCTLTCHVPGPHGDVRDGGGLRARGEDIGSVLGDRVQRVEMALGDYF